LDRCGIPASKGLNRVSNDPERVILLSNQKCKSLGREDYIFLPSWASAAKRRIQIRLEAKSSNYNSTHNKITHANQTPLHCVHLKRIAMRKDYEQVLPENSIRI